MLFKNLEKTNKISHGGVSMKKEEEMAVLPTEYRCLFHLENGFAVEQILFSHKEYLWLLTYQSVIKDAKNARKYLLVNRMMIRVNYKDGVMDAFGIDMDIINHANRGKKFFVGVDVSPKSRIFLELKYGLSEDAKEWILSEMRKGSEIITLGEVGSDLPTRFIETPFPMSDRFAIEGGYLAVPFLSREGKIESMHIPVDIRKRR